MRMKENADSLRVLKIVESNAGLPREGFSLHRAQVPVWRSEDKTKWQGI